MAEDARSRLRSIPALTGTAPEREDQFPADPVEMFVQWLEQALAAGVPEPHAMTVSTVDVDGIPDARVQVLKDVDERGWAFASESSSRKGHQLKDRPAAALSFWWQQVSRAVRVRGEAAEASPEESLADLRARSLAAQNSVDADDWTLWRVVPTRVEFWQGSEDREHQRIIYTREDGAWQITTSF